MKSQFIKIACGSTLVVFSAQAFALPHRPALGSAPQATVSAPASMGAASVANYNCVAGGNCCDPSVTTCAPGTVVFSAGSVTGQLAINADKSLTLSIKCASGNLTSYQATPNSKNVMCSIMGGGIGTPMVQLDCQNKGTQTAHVSVANASCK